MRISLNWLKKYVDIKISDDELVRLIGARLVEVEGVIDETHKYDNIYIVTDEEALETSRRLAREEGLMVGISAGTNVAAALKLAKKLGKGKTVVTVLPDTAERYFSTPLFAE